MKRLKTLTPYNIVMCTYLMHCEFVRCTFIVSHTQEESNIRQPKKIIILKINFKLLIELIMKTVKNIIANINSKFIIKHVTTRVARAPRTVRCAIT